MHSDAKLSGRAAGLALLLILTAAAAGAEGAAQATLPLEEILRLYRERDESAEPRPPQPPVAATVDRFELAGRLLDASLELRAQLQVTVLAEDRWVEVPLFERGDRLELASLPRLEGAVLTLRPKGGGPGQELVLLSRRPGVYAFALDLRLAAERRGVERLAGLTFAGASLARMTLEADDRLFTIAGGRGEGIPGGPEGLVVYPDGRRFEIAWRRRAGTAAEPAEAAVRPPLEPRVLTAHASAVSTLEGRLLLRVLYRLRLDEPRLLALDLPPGVRLDRVYRNGAALAVEDRGETLEIEVRPARPGDPAATLELVLSQDQGGYNLSGSLLYTLPAVAWPVHDLYVDLHLPKVFNYAWAGGSLAPAEGGPEASFTFDVPAPGKRLSFRQQLLTGTAATLRVDYDIDLAEQVFRGGG